MALASETPPFAVLWISGPGGIGKSSLLRRFAALAGAAKVTAVTLDARNLISSPDQCLAALGSALGLPAGVDPRRALHSGGRYALLFDTAEVLGSLERWLREEFVPELPATCVVVVAGRSAPEPAWSSDAGWAELLRVVALRNLSPAESRAVLSSRSIPEDEHERLLSVTHGHPLALSLVAEVVSQGRGSHPVSPVQSPDVVRCLLERFSHDAPDDAHRQALYAAAHSRVTDEATLRAAVGTADSAALYDWLRSLSFVEQSSEGLHLHDLAAEALESELRRRDPARHRELHARLRRPLSDRLRKSTGLEQYRVATDMAWMHRFSPVMSSLVNWPEARSLYRAVVSPDERQRIIDVTRKFEGDAAARLAEFWLERRPDDFVAIRSSRGGEGYICSLLLDATAEEEGVRADPRVAAALAHARASAPLRDGDLILIEMWAAYETHNAPSAMVSQVAVQSLVRYLGTPRLAWSFYALSAHLETWMPFMAYIDHAPSSAVDVGATRYQLVAHDWRKTPPDAFWDFMSERELHGGASLPEAAREPPLLVLSQEEFGDTVRRTLRDIPRPETLSQSLLSRCRVVVECPYLREGKSPVRTVLESAAESLVTSPKDEKLYSVIKATFLTPSPTQEAAAERLGLPFSTYRRHLGNAVERIVDYLWHRELHGWSERG